MYLSQNGSDQIPNILAIEYLNMKNNSFFNNSIHFAI